MGYDLAKHRKEDDNARRHASLFALFDWCWGGDAQWLFQISDEHKTYSHDHGWYLPEEGADWSRSALLAHVDEEHFPSWDPADLAQDEIKRVAEALRSVTRSALRDILQGVPASWSVTNAELEAVGFFMERRAPAAAKRLEALL